MPTKLLELISLRFCGLSQCEQTSSLCWVTYSLSEPSAPRTPCCQISQRIQNSWSQSSAVSDYLKKKKKHGKIYRAGMMPAAQFPSAIGNILLFSPDCMFTAQPSSECLYIMYPSFVCTYAGNQPLSSFWRGHVGEGVGEREISDGGGEGGLNYHCLWCQRSAGWKVGSRE